MEGSSKHFQGVDFFEIELHSNKLEFTGSENPIKLKILKRYIWGFGIGTWRRSHYLGLFKQRNMLQFEIFHNFQVGISLQVYLVFLTAEVVPSVEVMLFHQ